MMPRLRPCIGSTNGILASIPILNGTYRLPPYRVSACSKSGSAMAPSHSGWQPMVPPIRDWISPLARWQWSTTGFGRQAFRAMPAKAMCSLARSPMRPSTTWLRLDATITPGIFGRAIDETRRVLKPGGGATIMVYSAYSYRRWARWAAPALAYFLWDKFGLGEVVSASDGERAAYDADSTGAAAPETVFVSASHFRRLAATGHRSRFSARTSAESGHYRVSIADGS